MREGSTVQALRAGKKPARVKRWQTWTAHLESLTQKRRHNVARGCSHSDTTQQARARALSLTHSLTLSLIFTHFTQSAQVMRSATHSATYTHNELCAQPRWFLLLLSSEGWVFPSFAPLRLLVRDITSPAQFLSFMALSSQGRSSHWRRRFRLLYVTLSR